MKNSAALTCTLNASASLTEDLLNEGYEFVIPSRLQSDPLERRFSGHRQMSGGRFLVGLREVLNSEKIVLLKSLLKENICFWEGVRNNISNDNIYNMEAIKQHVTNMENEIQESVLSTESEEVAVYISGYITKKLIKCFNCEDCKILLLSDKSTIAVGYIKMLNRGGLLIPSSGVCSYSIKCFAILDVIHDVLIKHVPNNIKNSAEHLLSEYSPLPEFCCPVHNSSGGMWVCQTISNIYFNNEQKISNAEIRKDDINKFKARQTEKR